MCRAVEVRTYCVACGEALDADPGEPEDERTPCPACGSTDRAVEGRAADTIAVADIFAKPQVRRGVPTLRTVAIAIAIVIVVWFLLFVVGQRLIDDPDEAVLSLAFCASP
jgi:uncharacterized membrane protein YvbJ